MIASNRQVVFDDEPTGHEMMHIRDFRKGQCFADISGELLSQGAIPTFPVIGLPAVFANAPVGFFWKDFLIRLPKITERVTMPILVWNLVP